MEKLKQLRELTGAGISDCKKALDEASGDMDKAVEILRKQGIAKAAKRSEREASEGIIKVGVNDDSTEGYMVEINAETDFVARNEKFKDFSDKVFEIIKSNKPGSRDELLSLRFNDRTVKEELESLSGIIGEKLDIKDMAILKSNGTVAAYSHMGGKIGALVALDKKEQAGLAKSMAMQVAASNPSYIKTKNVPEDEINKEKDIYREQLKKEGKPDNILDKIIEGKLKKYYEEVCLLEQEYIMEDKKKVRDILGDAEVEEFVRYSL